jgi:outer membrane receptor protein involved in Fe transport
MIKLRLVISLGNPDLTWEKANQFQTGVEFGLGKYIASVDYYSKKQQILFSIEELVLH